MSYRVYVNDYQLFGNDESFEKWDNFLRKEKVHINEDGTYDGYITDVMGAIKVLEEIVFDKEARIQKRIAEMDKPKTKKDKEWMQTFGPRSLFDFTKMADKIKKYPDVFFLLDEIKEAIYNDYMFLPVTFLMVCEDMIEPVDPPEGEHRLQYYQIKPGCKIHVEAH